VTRAPEVRAASVSDVPGRIWPLVIAVRDAFAFGRAVGGVDGHQAPGGSHALVVFEHDVADVGGSGGSDVRGLAVILRYLLQGVPAQDALDRPADASLRYGRRHDAELRPTRRCC
jgi:hypothetical protein